MSRLTDIAQRLRNNAANTKTPDFLEHLDRSYTLRLRGHTRDHSVKYDENGNIIYDCYMPHYPMTGAHRARTKKVMYEFRQQIEKHFNVKLKHDAVCYREYVLLLLEHAVRELRIQGNNATVTLNMLLPLPKSEWLINKRKEEKETK